MTFKDIPNALASFIKTLFYHNKNRFLKISLSLSYYKIYYIFYLNIKKTTRLLKISTIKELEVDNSKIVGINDSNDKPLHY